MWRHKKKTEVKQTEIKQQTQSKTHTNQATTRNQIVDRPFGDLKSIAAQELWKVSG